MCFSGGALKLLDIVHKHVLDVLADPESFLNGGRHYSGVG
jgi:hypothetical protein